MTDERDPDDEGRGAETAAAVGKACRCGHTIASPAVVPEPRYSVLGTLTLIYGVTAKPKAIDYRCTRCGVVIHSARDERTIREHTA